MDLCSKDILVRARNKCLNTKWPTYIEVYAVLVAFAPLVGRVVGRHKALSDGGYKLVPLALHEERCLDDLVPRGAEVRTCYHLRQTLRTLL